MDIANFPSLTGDEFLEACHYLDSKYCRATLGPVRSAWKLKLQTSQSLDFNIYGIPTTYVEITRPLKALPTHHDIELELARFSISDNSGNLHGADAEMMDHEDADEAALRRPPVLADSGYVTYEIHLHPTYQMPCLWFRLWNLPGDERALDLDTVFRHLVPKEYKEGLRRYGGVGGISIDHHPINGSPCFFVHPCLAGDNMAGFECSRESYLTIWLGVVGGCVGLWIPKEMVAQ